MRIMLIKKGTTTVPVAVPDYEDAGMAYLEATHPFDRQVAELWDGDRLAAVVRPDGKVVPKDESGTWGPFKMWHSARSSFYQLAFEDTPSWRFDFEAETLGALSAWYLCNVPQPRKTGRVYRSGKRIGHIVARDGSIWQTHKHTGETRCLYTPGRGQIADVVDTIMPTTWGVRLRDSGTPEGRYDFQALDLRPLCEFFLAHRQSDGRRQNAMLYRDGKRVGHIQENGTAWQSAYYGGESKVLYQPKIAPEPKTEVIKFTFDSSELAKAFDEHREAIRAMVREEEREERWQALVRKDQKARDSVERDIALAYNGMLRRTSEAHVEALRRVHKFTASCSRRYPHWTSKSQREKIEERDALAWAIARLEP